MKKINANFEGVVTGKTREGREYQYMSFVKKADYDKDSKVLIEPTAAYKVYVNEEVDINKYVTGKSYAIMIEAPWKSNAMVID